MTKRKILEIGTLCVGLVSGIGLLVTPNESCCNSRVDYSSCATTQCELSGSKAVSECSGSDCSCFLKETAEVVSDDGNDQGISCTNDAAVQQPDELGEKAFELGYISIPEK